MRIHWRRVPVLLLVLPFAVAGALLRTGWWYLTAPEELLERRRP